MRPQDPFIGRDILDGQFQILQKIGSGGMGTVYKALQPAMNRMVAVKILHPKLANRKDLVSRFRREARAMSHLTHPNTVKVFSLRRARGRLALHRDGVPRGQEPEPDGPLARARSPSSARSRSSSRCAARSTRRTRRASSTAISSPRTSSSCQTRRLRDFPKVLDFGLAKVTEREMRPGSIILTQEGMVFGTPEFMSPEQAQGKTLTPASDIYSLAVILYEVLTGKLPFDAKSRWSTSSST